MDVAILVHSSDDTWPARVLRSFNAVDISSIGAREDVLEIHSVLFLRGREEKVLAAAAVANAALSLGRAVIYTGGDILAGLHSAREGHAFNAGVYIAKRTGAPVMTIDRHFPWGTWELHLEYKFPLYMAYGGSDGPSRRFISRRSDKAFALPLPPGAGDRGLTAFLEKVLKAVDGPLAIQLGVDIHKDDPTGYLFASDYFFYKMGEMLSARDFYLVLECASVPRVFQSAVKSLLDGLRRAGPPPKRHEESPKALKEVEAALRKL